MENEKEKSIAALREEKVLNFWEENQTFQKSLEKASPLGEFVFYEGPPTANGKPGIHHLEARSFKDIIPRYKTMKGFHVRRKGGWDTHGLPVELQVEKELGLKSKKDIDKYGVAEFNKKCRESVWQYVDLWNKFTERIGYWVDEKNPYITYENNYIESVWNVLKKVDDQKLLYKDYRVVPWCPRDETALSSHELAQGYQIDKDLSVTVKFKVKNPEKIGLSGNVFIFAWTTTPWTLPGNVALAVGNNIEYQKFKVENGDFSGQTFIYAKNKNAEISPLLMPKGEVDGVKSGTISYLKGSDLVGLEYEPLYPYLVDTIPESEKPKLEKAFKVYAADFVNTEDGTGIVHTAVMYGQDDFELGTKIGLPKHHLVGLDGRFLAGTGPFEGRFVKDEDVAIDIIKDLAHRGLLFKKEKYEHSYPHCWRCHTALIYYARDSWYIRMSDPKIKEQLINQNQEINWEPAHIRDGRFGEWLKDIKDWAISRERYWGTPLPVWDCDKCQKRIVISSIEDLKSHTKKSGNNYFVMRHGETNHNLKNLVSTVASSGSHLTEEGEKQVAESAKNLKDKKIDLVLVSPFHRTLETAKIVQDILGLSDEQIKIDDRLHEMSLPEYEGRNWDEYHKDYPKTVENFSRANPGNESYSDVKRRIMSLLFEVENTYKDKNILFITHGGPSWLVTAGARMLDTEGTLDLIRESKDFHYFQNAEVQELKFVSFSHDENYNLDLHRPYIDSVPLVCECGGNMNRTKEVMDVWFDSGSMPFAQDHYPFENKEWVDEKGYPADFISEAIDQTRGWFYTLHAVGILMGKGKAYKNVICLGHLLDKDGKKMSKSLGNVVDPWTMINKYGVDTLRLWMYSVNQPGESKNFDEKTVSELHNKVFNLLYNVLAFYELYRDKDLENLEYKKSDNIMDRWIISRLSQLIENMQNQLDLYKVLEPARAIREFIDDLSTWYVRRSRDRIKDGDKEAKETLYFVLKNLIKVMAPFTPFASEDIWQQLKNDNDVGSVHLAEWPEIKYYDQNIITNMLVVRNIVSLGLQSRQKVNIPVRQPLNSLKIKYSNSGIIYPSFLSKETTEIILDEINIKYIIFEETNNPIVQQIAEIDTKITPELKQEGDYRELVRAIQDMRKKKGLNPSDVIDLQIQASVGGQELINKFKADLLKTVGAKEIKIIENEGVEIKIDELVFKINF